jgi:CAAX protease family protein
MKTADLIYLALIAIGLFLDSFVLWPAFLQRFKVDPGQARLWWWKRFMILFWTMAAAGCALWLLQGRAWGLLRLTLPHGWRLWGSVGLVLAFVLANVPTVAKMMRSKRSLQIRLPDYAVKMTPHTGSEVAWFMPFTLTAGFCEEFLFRGYLIWVLQPLLGLWGAAAGSLIVFVAVHSYQDAKGILAVGITGALLTLVVLGSRSLWPAIALHTVIDAVQGAIAWLVFRRMGGGGVAVAA